ncbi:Cbb3-type cytochrome c oxidase subunit CcoN1 [compost metagenome]
MWRAVNADGTLTYSFVETLVASHPGFIVRFVGGAIFLTGMLLMAWNTWRTVRAPVATTAPAAAQLA